MGGKYQKKPLELHSWKILLLTLKLITVTTEVLAAPDMSMNFELIQISLQAIRTHLFIPAAPGILRSSTERQN